MLLVWDVTNNDDKLRLNIVELLVKSDILTVKGLKIAAEIESWHATNVCAYHINSEQRIINTEYVPMLTKENF